jgi:hypothetical protein
VISIINPVTGQFGISDKGVKTTRLGNLKLADYDYMVEKKKYRQLALQEHSLHHQQSKLTLHTTSLNPPQK